MMKDMLQQMLMTSSVNTAATPVRADAAPSPSPVDVVQATPSSRDRALENNSGCRPRRVVMRRVSSDLRSHRGIICRRKINSLQVEKRIVDVDAVSSDVTVQRMVATPTTTTTRVIATRVMKTRMETTAEAGEIQAAEMTVLMILAADQPEHVALLQLNGDIG